MAVFLIALVILLIWIGWKGTLFVLGLAVAGGIIAVIYQSQREASERARILAENRQHSMEAETKAKTQIEICKKLITNHIEELSTKEKQLTHSLGYGVRETKKWEQEKKRFITLVIKPAVSGEFLLTEESISSVVDTAIAQFREKYHQLANTSVLVSENCTGVEYEVQCADLLKASGWQANTTAASGDQGADIIAQKAGVKVVIQCKRYSGSVGNKAVQEAHAAKTHYNATKAIVISNARYTRSAKELANSLNVLLLHHDQIPKLDVLLHA